MIIAPYGLSSPSETPVEPGFGTRRHRLFGHGWHSGQASANSGARRSAVATPAGTPYSAAVRLSYRRPADMLTHMDTPMTKRTRQWRFLIALLFSLSLALTPSLAEARAGTSFGGGFSGMGSRGLRSFEGNGAAPLSRSLASPESSPGAGYGYGGGGFFSRHPFLTGIFGGFIGSILVVGGVF